MVAGIVVTHGNLAEELLSTARSVFGEFSGCYALTNKSKTTDALVKDLDDALATVGDARCVIFVDFVGGSCSHACLRQASHRQDHSPIPIISGVNLPMLLAFLNKRDEVPFEELTDVILDRSHNSIQVLDPSRI